MKKKKLPKASPQLRDANAALYNLRRFLIDAPPFIEAFRPEGYFNRDNLAELLSITLASLDALRQTEEPPAR